VEFTASTGLVPVAAPASPLLTMNYDSSGRERSLPDRRKSPTSPIDALRPGGRRTRPRRINERRGGFFVDRFDAATLALVITLLCLTILDGVLTIELLGINSEEANPFMRYLLRQGHLEFLLGKYVLTAIGLPFIVVYKNYRLCGSRVRIGFLLPLFIGLYLVLIAYQWTLFRAGGARGRVDAPDLATTAAAGCGGTILETRATMSGHCLR
jgi:Domain of unknown function (DUF5658)